MEFRKTSNKSIDKKRVYEISQKFSVKEQVAELLLVRGMEKDDEIEHFLNPSFKMKYTVLW